MNSIISWIRQNILYIAWGQALIAMLGSLYFSEVELFVPCMLCWYQRIAIYPLVFMLPIAITSKDRNIWKYGLALAIPGWHISLYHNLLYYNILPESEATCRAGVSCTTEFIEWFGFITIPLLSFIALSVIISCMLIYRRNLND